MSVSSALSAEADQCGQSPGERVEEEMDKGLAGAGFRVRPHLSAGFDVYYLYDGGKMTYRAPSLSVLLSDMWVRVPRRPHGTVEGLMPPAQHGALDNCSGWAPGSASVKEDGPTKHLARIDSG